MKKTIKLSENDISKIVEKRLNEMLEGYGDEQGQIKDPNTVIDEIGAKIVPINQELARLWFIYEDYQSSSNPMLKLFMQRLKTAYDCISAMEGTYNH